MAVNGRPPGSELRVEAGENKVLVEGSAVCNFGLDCIEIVRNGAVVKRVEGTGGQTEIECVERVSLDESAWFAVRARGRVEPERYGGVAPWNLYAHTSPVYVLRGNRPIRVAADLTGMVDYIRMVMEVYRRRGVFATDDQRREMMANGEKALAFYEGALRPIAE